MALMELTPQSKVLEGKLGTIGVLPPEEEQTPDEGPSFFTEVVPAAFRMENEIGSALSDKTASRFFNTEIESGYDSLKDIEGYEEYAPLFIRANNPNQTAQIKNQIDRENQDRETIDKGGWMGTLAVFSAGLLSPTTFIPVGGAGFQAFKGGKILKGALSTARATAIGMTASEAALHATQETRTLGESASNITVGTFIGGIAGGAIAGLAPYLKKTGRTIQEFYGKVDEDLTVPPIDKPDLAMPNSLEISKADLLADTEVPTPIGEGGSVGAAMVSRTEAKLKSTFGIAETIKTDPLLRVSSSPEVEVRRTIQELAETPLYYQENALGIPTGSDRTKGAVETRVKWISLGLKYRSNQIIRDNFEAIKKSNSPYKNIPYEQYKEEVSKAMRRNDQSSIPEVEKTAQELRKTIFDPLKEEAIANQLLPEDVSVSTASSYLTRSYDRVKIGEQRAEFKKRLVSWFKKEFETNKNKADIDLPANKAELESLKLKQKKINQFLKKHSKKKKSQSEDIKQKIKESRIELKSLSKQIDELKALLRGNKKYEDAPDLNYLSESADRTIDRILHTPGAQSTFQPVQIRMKNGVFKNRALTIPDEWIEDFLLNDVELLSNRIISSMVPQIEMVKKFGSIDMADQIAKINEGYTSKINAIIGESPEAKALRTYYNKKWSEDIRDLKGMRDRILGTWGLNRTEVWRGANLEKYLSPIKTWNFSRFMGRYIISTATDTGNLVIKNGLMRTFGDTIIPMVRNLRSFVLKNGDNLVVKEVKEELKDFGIGVDMALNTTVENLADLGIKYADSKLLVATGKLNKAMSKYSGISAIEDILNTITGYTGMARIVRTVTKKSMSPKDREFLAYLGIDQYTAKKMQAQLKEFGSYAEGVYSSGARNWTDKEAYEALGSAVKKFTDVTRVIPGQDKPFAFSTPWGSTILQFKSYFYSAYQRLFLSGLQQRDMATVSGAFTLVGLGMLSFAMKARLSGRELPEDPEDWILEGIDQSGVLGLLMEANNVLEKATGGVVGVSSFTNAKPLSRYQSRHAVDTLLGPSIGLVNDFFSATSSLSRYAVGDPLTSPDLRAMRRLIPFQNHLVLGKVFDEAEESIKENLGIRSTKRKRKR